MPETWLVSSGAVWEVFAPIQLRQDSAHRQQYLYPIPYPHIYYLMKFRNYYFWVAAIGSITLDIFTKQAVVRNLQLMQTFPLIPHVLHFTYIRNNGAAFSLFQGHEWLKWLSLIVSMILMAIGIFKAFSSIWEQLGFGLILAGAAGNGIDRFLFGSVVDFIDIKLIHFAVFNWADVSINLGIICLLIHSFIDGSARSNSR